VQLLTTAEAAAYLRLKERKIYEMVAEGAVPCTKVTGRWLFPKTELDLWLAASVLRPAGVVRSEPAPIITGSHDPLLEWALRESGSGLATLAVGSEAGFARFVAGEMLAAAIHLHSPDGETTDANTTTIKNCAELHDAVLIALWRREQGFLVPPGNPLKLGSIEDVSRTRARIAVRPKGAGAQLLLLALLHRANISLDQLTVATPLCPIGPDIAQAIRVGRADTGIATRGVAASAGLDFVPITWESFDLVTRQQYYFKPSMQTLFNFLRSEGFATRAGEFGGYDLSVAGMVRFVS